MLSEKLLKVGATKTWRGAGGDYDLSLESRAQNAAAQGEKGDIGPKWAEQHNFEIVVETGGSAPTKGGSYELWWAHSVSATPGNNNPGGTTGVDETYKAGQEDEWKVQLDYIGRLIVTNDSNTIMRTYVKGFLKARYGMPVVVNKTNQTSAADHNECYIAVHEVIDEGQ